ncbi:MFS transporter [Vagococcus martis]|uniref:MFS transporter n=1 Tax=Vagococcus martis TaxID=1768210 RepID=A0A1V4DE74_9ENTE|nr:MFS transporter [Vagococcus martis]OPF86839.1 MFS transporter [Vagococcus martis]
MQKKQNLYNMTILSLYINYILQGMATIIITQNMSSLMNQFNTNTKGISLVISFIGVGRVVSLLLAGRLSDKFSRKMSIWLGMFSYAVFFGGMLFCENLLSALFVTLFAGFANAFLDTGTYPTLIEAYPDKHAFLSVLNKFFISVGQFCLPLFVSFLTMRDLSYRYSFIVCFIILVCNGLNMWYRVFPNTKMVLEKEKILDDSLMATKPKFMIEGLSSIVFGFTSVSTFNILLMWLPDFGEKVGDMSRTQSLMLISIYSIGSIVSVFLTSYLVKTYIKPIYMIVGCSFFSFCSLMMLLIFPYPPVIRLVAFSVGVFASGGIWQLSLSLFLEMFPQNKGRMTSYYTLATSFSVMVTPILTGYLSELSLYYVFIFNGIVTFIGFFVSIVIKTRYQKIFPTLV